MLAGNKPLPVERFSGLNLRDDPEELGWSGAIDILNVDMRDPTRPRSRDGSSKFSTVAGAAAYSRLFSFRASASRLIATGTSLTDARDSTGAVVTSMAVGPASSMAMFGSPTGTSAYLAMLSGAITVRKFDGSSFSTPTATVNGSTGLNMPSASLVAVTPWDNRMAYANSGATGGPNGVSSSSSHVWFSNPGDPEVFGDSGTSGPGANQYEILSPGDGEQITAMVAWREMLFVFKQTKFFVFTGTGTDTTGLPVFNYRTVNTGVGVAASSTGATVVAASDGVYLTNRTGVWKTTGGPAVLVSGVLDPLFRRETNTFFGPGNFAFSDLPGTLVALDRRVVVSCDGCMFVYDTDTQLWSYWEGPFLGAAVGHTFVLDDPPDLYYSLSTSNDVARFVSGATTDPSATAITSKYRSGFLSPAGPGVEVTIRETELNGSGTVQFGWSRDFVSSVDATANVTLGAVTWPANVTRRGYHRVAKAGESLSWRIASVTGGAWQINRVVPFLREARGAAEKTT